MDNIEPHENAFLLNATDEQEALAEFASVIQLYKGQPIPYPSPEASQKLFLRLLNEEVVHRRIQTQERASLRRTFRMARWHFRLLGPWFWLSSMPLFLLSVLLASTMQVNGGNVLIVLLPLIALLNVVSALHRLKSRAREIEASCPTSVVEVLAGLVFVIVCFDGTLGLLATLGIALVRWTPFLPLFTAWLGPMLFLAGIAFPIALRKGTSVALAMAGGPWLFLISIAIFVPSLSFQQFLLLEQVGPSLLIHLLMAGLGILLLLFFLFRGATWQRSLVQA